MKDIQETKDLLRKLEPTVGVTAKRLWYLNLLSEDSSAAHQNLDMLRLLADRRARFDFKETIRFPPPSPDLLKGEYHLGTVLYPEQDYSKIGLTEDEFIKHLLIVGMTGAGKTNLTFQILRELARHGKPFLIFDWKRGYRALRQLPEFRDLKVISLGREDCGFKFNPLIPPPGIHPRNWLALLIDVMSHAFFFAHGVEYFLRKGIHALYDQFGIYEGKTVYPTFSDLQRKLPKEFVRGREMLWMSSVKRVLASLTSPGVLSETLNVRNHEGIEDLLEGQVIVEMDNLPTVEKVFMVEALLLWIYQYRKSQGIHERFRHAIVIEEAHHVLSGLKEARLGQETIIEMIVRMIREFGESVIVIDQEPDKLSKSILANTYCKISFNLGNGLDVRTIGHAMNLREEEQRLIDRLKVGHAILKLKGRFFEPVHIHVPLVPITKDTIKPKPSTNPEEESAL